MTKQEQEGLRRAVMAVERARAAQAQANRLVEAGNAGAPVRLTARRLRLLALIHAVDRPVSPAELAFALRADLAHLKRDLKALGATAAGAPEALVVIVDPGGPPRRHRSVAITDRGAETLAHFGAAVHAASADP